MSALTPQRDEEWVARYRTGTYAADHDVVMRDARNMLAVIDELADELSRTKYQLTSANGKATRHEATLGGILVALHEGGLIK